MCRMRVPCEWISYQNQIAQRRHWEIGDFREKLSALHPRPQSIVPQTIIKNTLHTFTVPGTFCIKRHYLDFYYCAASLELWYPHSQKIPWCSLHIDFPFAHSPLYFKDYSFFIWFLVWDSIFMHINVVNISLRCLRDGKNIFIVIPFIRLAVR